MMASFNRTMFNRVIAPVERRHDTDDNNVSRCILNDHAALSACTLNGS